STRLPVVVDRVGVEYHQIGGQAAFDSAPIAQVHALGVEAGHASHGLGQRQQVQLAHVAPEQAREGAVGGGVIDAVAGEDGVGLEAAGTVLQHLAQAALLGGAAGVGPVRETPWSAS